MKCVGLGLFSVDDCAVGAAEVFNVGRIKYGHDVRVMAPDGWIVNVYSIVLVTANAQRTLFELMLVDFEAVAVDGYPCHKW